MKSIFVIDTNVILRYLLGDHAEFSRQARDLLDDVKIGKTRAYIPESVIAECVYVLLKVYGVPRTEIAEKLTGILRYKGIVNGNTVILTESLRLFSEKNVDIVDALVHATAQAHGWRSCSFDRDFKKLE